MSFVFPYGRGQTPEYSAESPNHMALIAKTCICRNIRRWQVRFTQQASRMLNPESRNGIHEPFAGRTSVRCSQPRRVQSHLSSKFEDAPARVVPETPGYMAKPIGAS